MPDTLPIYDICFTTQLICLIAMKINNLFLLSLIVSLTKSIHFPFNNQLLQITMLYASSLLLNLSILLHVYSIWANNINQYPAPVELITLMDCWYAIIWNLLTSFLHGFPIYLSHIPFIWYVHQHVQPIIYMEWTSISWQLKPMAHGFKIGLFCE